jgi:tetratricopeptide (TPR) repeat protein
MSSGEIIMKLHLRKLGALCLLAGALGSYATAGDSGPVRSPTRQFSVPYQPEQLGLPLHAVREVALFYTQDNGRTWKPAGRMRPETAWFDFMAPSDGEYLFMVQAVDQDGRLHPPTVNGGPMPWIKVDTTAPEVRLEAWQEPSGEIVVRWAAHDGELVPESVELHYLDVDGANRWTRFASDRRENDYRASGLVGEARQSMTTSARQVVVRLTALDKSGNRAHQEGRVRVGPIQDQVQLAGNEYESPAAGGTLGNFDRLPPLRVAQSGPSLTGTPASQTRPVEPFSAQMPALGEPPAPLDRIAPLPQWQAQAGQPQTGPGVGGAPGAQPGSDTGIGPLPRQPAPMPQQEPIIGPLPRQQQPMPNPEDVGPMPREELPQPMPLTPEDLEDNLERNILLRAARNALANGELPEAVERFALLLDRFPTDTTARSEYAGILVTLGRYEESIAQFQILVEQDPSKQDYLRGLVDVYIQTRRYEDAIALLTSALEQAPDSMPLAVQLARVYAFAERREEGYEVYRRYLANRDIKDTSVLLNLAPLLLLLERPTESLPMFQELLSRPLPEDRENPDYNRLLTIVNTVRNYHALGNERDALALVQQMVGVRPNDIELRLSLGLPVVEPAYGNALVAPESRDAGLIVYSQVLSQDPQNLTARLNSAQIYLKTFELHRARAILFTIRPEELYEDEDERLYNLVLARYHTLSGEFPDGVAIYNRLLANNPQDVIARVSLGDLWYDAGEHGKAKATYLRSLSLEPRDPSILFRLARNDWLHHYFADAESTLAQLLHEDRYNMEAFRLMIDVLLDSDQLGKAEDLARSVRPRAETDVRVRFEQHLALAKVYRRTGRNTEAMYECQAAMRLPYGPMPEILWEHYMAIKCVQDKHQAKDMLSTAISKYTDPIYSLVTVSRFAILECQDELAIELMNHAIGYAPDNWIQKLILAQAMQGHVSLDPSARGMYAAVVGVSPTNIPARLGIARINNSEKDFGASVDEYNGVLAHMPTSTIAHREKARVVSARLGCDGSCKEWSQAIENAKRGEPFIPPRPAVPDQSPHGGVPITMGLTSDKNGLPIYAPVIGEGSPEPPPVLFQGDSKEAVAAATEKSARCKTRHRPCDAVPLWEALITIEPSQPSHYFDLGQAHAARNQTHAAMEAYRRQLDVDPCAREAAIALNRSWLDIQPRLTYDHQYFFQRGRDGLADIYYNRFGATFTMPVMRH